MIVEELGDAVGEPFGKFFGDGFLGLEAGDVGAGEDGCDGMSVGTRGPDANATARFLLFHVDDFDGDGPECGFFRFGEFFIAEIISNFDPQYLVGFEQLPELTTTASTEIGKTLTKSVDRFAWNDFRSGLMTDQRLR